MTKQDFINVAHGAHDDAGSQVHFNECMTAAADALNELPHAIIDPVAAFLSAALLISGDDPKQAIESLEFYTGELLRAKQALEDYESEQG